MHSLPIFLDLRDRAVMLIGDGDAADAKRRLIERAGAVVVNEDDGRARIAIVAVDGDREAESAAARLKARGLLVNVTDRPALCDFMLPAIVDRDPLLIAIGTAGRSAGLAKALRQRIELLLPHDLGGLASALFAARDRIRARWPDAASRRRAIDAALDEGAALDPLQAGARERLGSWLDADDDQRGDRIVAIALLSADPDDLTLGQARLLGHADRVFHRPGIPSAILDRARADAIRIPCDAPPAPAGPGLSIDLDWA